MDTTALPAPLPVLLGGAGTDGGGGGEGGAAVTGGAAGAAAAGPSAEQSAQPDLTDLARCALGVRGRARPALDLLDRLAAVPLPASGRTLERWEVLATLAAVDLTAARVAEAHLDALAIREEVRAVQWMPGEGGRWFVPSISVDPGEDPLGAYSRPMTWGVFAAEAPGARLEAVETTRETPGERPRTMWTLTGTKPWCSLAGLLTHALVTAHTGAGRRLFSVDLRHPGVAVRREPRWVSRGLADVASTPVDFTDVPAVPIGEAGWYLRRPGFTWGGLGVAACWYGGAVGVARALRRAAAERAPDQVALVHAGAVDAALAAARALLVTAAAAVDAGRADGGAGAVLALRVRSGVAAAAEEVLSRVGHALGPAPLTFDEEHARRVADLTVYLRQHHAERDLAALGEAVLGADGAAW